MLTDTLSTTRGRDTNKKNESSRLGSGIGYRATGVFDLREMAIEQAMSNTGPLCQVASSATAFRAEHGSINFDVWRKLFATGGRDGLTRQGRLDSLSMRHAMEAMLLTEDNG